MARGGRASGGGSGARRRSCASDFGEHIKEWAKSSPRAKAIDWSNLRKGLAKCESDGERLFACYEYLAEPFLADDYRTDDGKRSVPVFIKDYPFEVSPLARRNDAHPELTDRFELFVHGRELCNAFSELNDPDDQAARFRAQVEKKARGDEETMDYDEDYIRALEHGMPPAAGFGMGIDRLVMALTNAASIRDVILFPLLRPEAGRAVHAREDAVPSRWSLAGARRPVAAAIAFLVWRAAHRLRPEGDARAASCRASARVSGRCSSGSRLDAAAARAARVGVDAARHARARRAPSSTGVLFLVGTVVALLPVGPRPARGRAVLVVRRRAARARQEERLSHAHQRPLDLRAWRSRRSRCRAPSA